MRLFLFSIIIIFFFGCSPEKIEESECQDSSIQVFKEKGKYGYKCKSRIIIPAIYDKADKFSMGYAGISLNGKFGIINKKNKIIIKPTFDFAAAREDYILVSINDANRQYIQLKKNLKIEAAVTGDDVNIRSGPNLNYRVTAQFSKGTIVEVLEASKHKIDIKDKLYYWMYIKKGIAEGWICNAYLSYKYIKNKNTITWIKINHENSDDRFDYYDLIQYNYITKSDKTEQLSGDYFMFSESGHYLAACNRYFADYTIAIYDINSFTKIIYEALYKSDIKWTGDELKYNHKYYSSEKYILWEEKIFKNGKTYKTGKKGKGPGEFFD